MSINKVTADIENECHISELKIRRNQGKLDPDVIEFCSSHLEAMANHLQMLITAKLTAPVAVKAGYPSLDDTVAYLKTNPDKLLLVSTFMDEYDEVLKWNALHSQNVIPCSVTYSHREVDHAMFNTICAWDNRKWAGTLSRLLYHYSRRGE